MNPTDDSSVARILQGTEKAANSRRLVQFAPLIAALREFIASGDERWLQTVAANPPQYLLWWLWADVFEVLAAPDQIGLGDRRLLAFARVAEMKFLVQSWMEEAFSEDGARPDGFQRIAHELAALGWTLAEVAELWANMVCFNRYRDAADTRRHWFLAMDESGRQEVLRQVLSAGSNHRGLLVHCAGFAPGSVRKFLDESPALAARAMELSPHWTQMVRDHGGLFEADAVRALHAAKTAPPHERFALAHALYQFAPERYRTVALETARTTLRTPNTRMKDAANWLAETLGAEVVPEFVDKARQQSSDDIDRHVLLEAAAPLGRDAGRAVCEACLDAAPVEERLTPIQQLLAWGEPADRARATEAIAAGLAAPKNPERVRYLGMVEAWMLPDLEPLLWKLMEDTSKPTREATAALLAGQGAVAIPRAAALLAARRATTRLAAVSLLARLPGDAGAEEARATLRARLDAEMDETVREALLNALPDAAPPAPGPVPRESLDALVGRTADMYKRSPAAWLDEAQLPPLFLTGAAEPLPPAAVRFLLHRQARGKEIDADTQARPLLDALDRARSGDFALAVLQGFLASSQAAGDRWALAVAGLLGDGRTLRGLVRQIPEWVDRGRGKLAEYAAEAVALLGTDEALLALDALSIRYRSKNKNVGTAATTAFARAAEARGLTTDELGDRVVPRLGFPPEGGPRVVAVGERRVEVRVGLDFKLALLDADSHRKVAAWPAGMPPEIKAEMKETTAALREAAKAQTLRLENQFVRQRRWPVARWRELFLAHPLLVPFAVRLVWGEYAADDGREKPRTTFRALPDGVLTDTDDDTPALGPDAFVGIVHPLELDADHLQTWQTHLDDYEVETQFPQLGRPVVVVAPEQAGDKSFDAAGGAEVNALGFKSRTEKRGWTRGSVVDGGGVYFYTQRFPGAAVDAILHLEGMHVAAGMDDTVTLRHLQFVRAGSVKIAGYTYDVPSDDQDPRLIALGDVPPVVFSEAAGGVRSIAGRTG